MSVRESQPAVDPPASRPAALRPWLWLLPALAAVLVYLPSLSGEFIWNDPDYVTKPELATLAGLGRIWTELGATEQYYPLLHSFFWIQQKLFRYDPLWYHVVNVLLHAACAALLVLIVRRLFQGRAAIPLADGPTNERGGLGMTRPATNTIAFLTGLIFAVHPVYVESVAWISEQKNTFSLLWYLLAGLAYLRWQDDRGGAGSTSQPGSNGPGGAETTGASRQHCPWWQSSGYWVATAFFLLAILSKSVTATLPCALMVVAWWRTGRLERATWVPLLPWVLLGLLAGAVTGWVEHHFIGARGDDFALTFIERGVLAGRVIWFYLGKYAWPADLIFIYPRWTVDTGVWWQWLFPAAALALLGALGIIRGRTRGPLAGYLIFTGSLVPTLGFFNVYAFKFSYVADHWNYLPSVALAVMAAWSSVWIRERWFARPAGWFVGCSALLLLLAALSARQTRGYQNLEIFYQTILRRNPDCWLAAHNLGGLRLDTGRYAEAVPYYEQALRVRPQLTEALNNLGGVLQRLGRREEAIARFEEALRWAPNDFDLHRNLGAALASVGRLDEAVVRLRRAVELKPADADLHRLLAQALLEAGRPAEAAVERAEFDRLQGRR
jgi:tetratricopeptide (TPR) repeat protein